MTVPKVAVSQWLEQIKKTQKHREEQGTVSHEHPYIFHIPELLRIERPDAYMPQLENQIPLFILKKVLEWQTGSETQALNRLTMTISSACKKFSPFKHVGNSPRSSTRECYIDLVDERHILECLYNFIVPNTNPAHTSVLVGDNLYHNGIVPRSAAFKFLHQMTSRFRDFLSQKSRKADINLPAAAELHRKGVKFCPFTWASAEIRFDIAGSTLFLPCIEMDYRTDLFLRNMVALEAFMKCKTRVFTCCADLMDRLVDTPNDVGVLKKYGIIHTSLGSDKEISILWNGIRRSIWRSPYDPIDNTIKAVNEYYGSRYVVLFGEFLQEHFSKPWRPALVIGACILLILSFLQTLFSYFELHQKCEYKRT
ncbi:hypothetical protein SUGI_1112460 [Cryptomeria japonica]|nr:hypothetical protein SUGI_1112460 [Cryptomeria japonica]